MVPFESLGTVSYSHSIVTMAQSCTISETKRDVCQKSRFFMPSAFKFRCPRYGDPRQNIAIQFGIEKKLEWCGYLMVEKRICLAVSTKYRRVTDRRTDGRRDIFRQHSIA